MEDMQLSTRNEGWGFYATVSGYTIAAPAWSTACAAIARATGASAVGVRDFLDSRHGRHFADDVANGMHAGLDLRSATDKAVARWMGWTIDRRMARTHGIPQGLPYLAGLVWSFEIQAERDD